MSEITVELQLGMKAREKITGVTGTVTCIAKYLYERPQAMIEYKDRNVWRVKNGQQLIDWR